MKILAADTSTASGSLALLDGESVVAEWTLSSAQTHNRRLLAAVDFLLGHAGWSLDDVDGFAVTTGPGSFTGLRIGLTTMKMLAWVKGKLFAGIPSLDALAYPFGFAGLPVCPMIDARKKEVYAAVFQPDGQGNVRLVRPYEAVSASRFAEKAPSPAIFCGNGWLLYRTLMKKKLGRGAIEAPAPFHLIRAGFAGELARKRFRAGDSDDPATSTPLYVRPSEAEINYPQHAARAGEKPEFL